MEYIVWDLVHEIVFVFFNNLNDSYNITELIQQFHIFNLMAGVFLVCIFDILIWVCNLSLWLYNVYLLNDLVNDNVKEILKLVLLNLYLHFYISN